MMNVPHVIAVTETDEGGESVTAYYARMDTRRDIPVFEDDASKAATFGSKREADHVIARLRDFWKREMVGAVPAFKARALAGRRANPSEVETPEYVVVVRHYADGSVHYYTGKGKIPAQQFSESQRHAKRFATNREAYEIQEKIRPMVWAAGDPEIRVLIPRGKNPVPPSRHAGNARPSATRVGKAADLYRRFTGNEPHKAARVIDEAERGDAFLRVGSVDGILYTTNRDGKAEKYIHHFRHASRPELLVSHDGKVARTLGGRFTFTERGFVDEDESGNAVE